MNAGRVAEAIRAMYTPGGRENLRKVMDQVFAQDVYATSPWLETRGKEDLFNTIRLWNILFDDRVDVKTVATEKDGTVILFDIHKLSPRFLPFLHIMLPYNTIIRLGKDNRIGSVVDHPSLYGITWNIPFFGWLWERYLKQVVGIGGSLFGSGLDTALEQVKSRFDWKNLDI